ncbi:MAG: hypothetical protein ACPHN2_08600 [Sinimarinibacterium flocculans]|uniref:hypothetical protein n=1 Tax=Sinimarinibacterium flocculans TaxID=985250 RepID=UPI003C45C0B9
MIIIEPIALTNANIVSNNLPAESTPAWDYDTVYELTDYVLHENHIWSSLTDENLGNVPQDGSTDWLDHGTVNRYRWFDGAPDRVSRRSGSIIVTIDPGTVFDCVALINVRAVTVTVEILDEEGEPTVTRTKTLIDTSEITDWHKYWWTPVERSIDAAFLDLPATASQVRVTIDALGGACSVGEIVLGLQRQIGDTLYGVRTQIKDFSRQIQNEFGQITLVRRGYTVRMQAEVAVPSDKNPAVKNFLARLRSTPILYIASTEAEETLLYGFYQSFELTRRMESLSFSDLTVESLVYEDDDPLLGTGAIATPTIDVPDDAESMPVNGIVRSSAFALASGFDYHAESDWQISTTEDFAAVEYESLGDTVNLTSWPLPGGLTTDLTRYVRARHRGGLFGQSAWSVPVQFTTTASAIIDTPTVTVSAMHDNDDPITTSAFATTPSSADTHTATRWQFATENTFAAPLVDVSSITDLTSIIPPATLPLGVTLYGRAMHIGRKLADSSWSAAEEFELVEVIPTGEVVFDTPGATGSWVVPADVTEVCVVAISAAGKESTASAGPGGMLRYVNALAVTPAESLDYRVGLFALTNSTDRHTFIKRSGTALIEAGVSLATSTTLGGDVGGGSGGKGYPSSNGGGGGCGGYAGKGGDGGEISVAPGAPQPNSGAAHGGHRLQNGGGVGLYGIGPDGTPYDYNGSDYGEGVYGRGCIQTVSLANPPAGAGGGLRIIWGPGRAFPSTNVG